MTAGSQAGVQAEALTFEPAPNRDHVSALLLRPREPRALYVFAHGAGAGMRHEFMEGVSRELLARGVATLRYQFPYTEQKKFRPDPPALLESTVRAAVQLAQKKCPGVPLFAGGKSMGGRMTSQAQAKEPLPGVRALVFLGFPLHPAGAPAIARAAHLADVQVPMLFLSGERDKLAELQLLRPVVDKLGARATLELIAEGDHGFDVPKRTGKTHEQILAGLAESMVRFALRIHIDRTE